MFWWLDFNPQINGWTVHWPWSGAEAARRVLEALLARHPQLREEPSLPRPA